MPTASLPDGWADALGRVLAKERESWRREREIAQAEARQTIAELRQEVAEYKLFLHGLQAADHELVATRVASVKDGAPGRDGAVGSEGSPGRDGAPGERGPAGESIRGERGEQGPEGPPGPPGEAGLRGETGERGADGDAGERGADGQQGEAGREGSQGKFAAPQVWTEGKVHYESDLVFCEGGTWCARRDTAQKPPHEDWSPVALKGLDAPVGEVRGLYDERATYRKFDLVAFNGAEFRARRDVPGALPGDGWALSAKQGKRGDKGDRGDRGELGKEGKQGIPGPTVVERKVEGFVLIDTLSDGTTIACDMRSAFERYDGEVR